MYPYHEEYTRCGQCQSTIKIRFRCPFVGKDIETQAKIPKKEPELVKPQIPVAEKPEEPPVAEEVEEQEEELDVDVEKSAENVEEEAEEQEKDNQAPTSNKRTGFVKQFEIRDCFEQNFDEYVEIKQPGAKGRVSKIKTMGLTRSEWQFL